MQKKKLNKIIEIPCEEDSKEKLAADALEYIIKNHKLDYDNGDVVVKSDRFEAVDIIIYDGCKSVVELTNIFTF